MQASGFYMFILNLVGIWTDWATWEGWVGRITIGKFLEKIKNFC